jgi:endonuclease/exonuclease/phosphatase family metal-dependent hydrolase
VPRWAGPPPLLVAATVLGILVAPAVSSADDAPPAAERGVLASVTPGSSTEPTESTESTELPTPADDELPTRIGAEPQPEPPSEPEPAPGPEPRPIGVATFNQYVGSSPDDALADALALTSRPGVSIVGWQEGYTFGPVYQALAERGWATKRYVGARGMRELAVSWRRDEFALESSAVHRLADGVGAYDGLFPFNSRYGLRVTLRDRASGERISVINTHLPQRIEDLDRPGTWRTTKNAQRAFRQLERLARIWRKAPGRWVVGTGDYNIAALADMRARNRGGLSRAYDDVARSTYAVLGFDGLEPTHPFSRRYIDYVHVAQPALRDGRIELLGHRTPENLTSDHLPLVAQMRLS